MADGQKEVIVMDEQFEELKKKAKPIVEWLKQNGHPYMQVIIDEQQVRVVEDIIGMPIENAD